MSAAVTPNFGPLQLLRRVSLGGMAEVFKARLAIPGGGVRMLAVKRLLPSLAEDPDLVRQFREEAELGCRLEHPGLLRGFGPQIIHGSPCSLWEYVEGWDLATVGARLREAGGRCSPEEVATIGRAVAEALACAHEARDAAGQPLGLVHRDVSPHNLMLGVVIGAGSLPDEGATALKLIDFGIAKRAGDDETRGGLRKGKDAYMSPEQVRGERLDPRSDLFSLATVLWELAAGERLWKGATAHETLERVEAAEAPRLTERVASFPGVLSRAIEAALSRDREHRPAHAAALADALAPLAGDPETVLRGLRMRLRDALPSPPDDASELDAYRAELRACEQQGGPDADAERTDATRIQE